MFTTWKQSCKIGKSCAVSRNKKQEHDLELFFTDLPRLFSWFCAFTNNSEMKWFQIWVLVHPALLCISPANLTCRHFQLHHTANNRSKPHLSLTLIWILKIIHCCLSLEGMQGAISQSLLVLRQNVHVKVHYRWRLHSVFLYKCLQVQ